MLLQLSLVYVLYINAEKARSNDNTSVFYEKIEGNHRHLFRQ